MTITLKVGDCRDVMPTLDQLFHACITDPPYELGFMGKKWDSTGVAFRPETWRAVYDRLLPGAYLVAFGGTRTYHRMVCAIEDAGFEIRDTLCWLYGSGFAKSHNISKAIDKEAGAVREVVGVDTDKAKRQTAKHGTTAYGEFNGNTGVLTAPATPVAAQWEGWGTALKPSHEPIVLARKPLIGTVAANVLAHGVGGLNIDASRIPATDKEPAPSGQYSGSAIGTTDHNGIRNGSSDHLGRWPANVCHDGSPDVLDAFAAFGERTSGQRNGEYDNGTFSSGTVTRKIESSTGSAARFFYSSKADAADRADSKHPTVKPVGLIRWLVKLVTPPGGHILDPFAGSGTTAEAAMLEGFNCTLIEQDPQHAADIRHRIKRWSGQDAPLFATLPAE